MTLNLTTEASDVPTVHTAVNGGYVGFDLSNTESLQIPYDGLSFHGTDYDT